MSEPARVAQTVVAPITVAVATVERPVELLRCLEGLLDGTVVPREVLVVHQGIDRETEAVVASIGRPGVSIRLIRSKERGLSQSRNTAISDATQPAVAFTDDDCVPAADWVAAIDRRLRHQDHPDAVTGRILPLGPPTRGTFAISSRSSERRQTYRQGSLPWRVGSGANICVRRAWLERVGPFDVRLGAGTTGESAEDVDYLYRLLRQGAVVAYEPDAVIYHERQSGKRRLMSRQSYGFGFGAFSAIWTARRDGPILRVALRWAVGHAISLARGLINGRRQVIIEETLYLRGFLMGFVFGLRQKELTPNGRVSPRAG